MTMKWRWVKGYEGKYKVSNTGLVKSYMGKIPKLKYQRNAKGAWQRRGKMDTPKRLAKGYHKKVMLQGKNYLVHRLVAMAFIPNPLNLPEINHIDLIKSNNRVGNLEWCTPSQNCQHRYLYPEQYDKPVFPSRKGTNNPASKTSKWDIKLICRLYNTGCYTQKELANLFNLRARQTIIRILKQYNHE